MLSACCEHELLTSILAPTPSTSLSLRRLVELMAKSSSRDKQNSKFVFINVFVDLRTSMPILAKFGPIRPTTYRGICFTFVTSRSGQWYWLFVSTDKKSKSGNWYIQYKSTWNYTRQSCFLTENHESQAWEHPSKETILPTRPWSPPILTLLYSYYGSGPMHRHTECMGKL